MLSPWSNRTSSQVAGSSRAPAREARRPTMGLRSSGSGLRESATRPRALVNPTLEAAGELLAEIRQDIRGWQLMSFTGPPPGSLTG
jgi:hypothetical protein